MCIHLLHPPFLADDTLLGELQLPPYNAVQASQGRQFQVPGAGRLVIKGMEKTHRMLQNNIIEAQERQTNQAGGRETPFAVGDKL